MYTSKKRTSVFILATIFSSLFIISSCKKEAGPVGPTGKEGNANVVLYKFAGNDFTTSSYLSQNIKMSQDSFDSYAWFGYLKYNTTYTYSMPGFGFGGYSNYRFYTTKNSPTSHDFSINLVTGPGEKYDSLKIVGVNISKIFGKKDPVDYTDFKAVTKYYGLPE